MSIENPHSSSFFSARLKQERRRLGMNQSDFGNAGGVLKQAQSNYEKGLRYPDASYLAGIAQAGVDVLYLLTGRASDPATLALDPDEERLLEHLNLLNDPLARPIPHRISGIPAGDRSRPTRLGL